MGTKVHRSVCDDNTQIRRDNKYWRCSNMFWHVSLINNRKLQRGSWHMPSVLFAVCKICISECIAYIYFWFKCCYIVKILGPLTIKICREENNQEHGVSPKSFTLMHISVCCEIKLHSIWPPPSQQKKCRTVADTNNRARVESKTQTFWWIPNGKYNCLSLCFKMGTGARTQNHMIQLPWTVLYLSTMYI